jgi:hypothetical protein
MTKTGHFRTDTNYYECFPHNLFPAFDKLVTYFECLKNNKIVKYYQIYKSFFYFSGKNGCGIFIANN